MINEKDLPWYDWAEDSKVRAIKEMAAYLKKETPSEYRITWGRKAPLLQDTEEETNKLFKEYATDDIKFAQCLLSFEACLATDMSWAKGIAKAAKGKRLQ